MDQDKKTNSGAPSSDTTSALFVSARKKQLEQQEAERKAKEQEEQRLAAEAEVRRLEAEVEERRRKAEEEARRVEQEAAEKRKQAEEEGRRIEQEAAEKRKQAEEEARHIAEEARKKKAQAAEDPDAILGTAPQKKEKKLPTMPKIPKMPGKKDGGTKETKATESVAAEESKSAFVAAKETKAPGNKKPIIIGAIVGVVALLAVVLAFALGGDSPEAPPEDDYTPAYEYDISGAYYLNGDPYEGELYFYSDGTFDLEYYGEFYEGTWYIEDDVIYGDTEDAAITLMIHDEDTLYYGSEDVFYREGTYEAPYEEEEWYLDEDAEFDSTASISTMAMGVQYPSSQFYLEDQTADGLTLKSHDGQAYINYNQLRQGTQDWTHEGIRAVQNALIIALQDSIPGAVVTENIYEESASRGYFALSYEQDGEKRYQYVIVQGWNNLTDGTQWFYAGLVDCPDWQSDEYWTLFTKIHAAKFDT